jgi:hypothetical protein
VRNFADFLNNFRKYWPLGFANTSVGCVDFKQAETADES